MSEATSGATPSSGVHEKKEYPRFRLMARIEHMILLVSFTILAITGLPQKYAVLPIAQDYINFLGGIEQVRIIHRYAAVVLVIGCIYHLLTSGYRLFVRRERNRMLPTVKDGEDLRDTVLYNIGRSETPPQMPKFNFGEKFEYWAVVWGTAVMVITGFVLWNPIAASRFLPGSFIPASLVAHGWEAVLAVASIVIWHLYNVLIKHRNLSMFTGVLTHEQMEEEHALELQRLEAGGEAWPSIEPNTLRRRRIAYFAVATVAAIIMLAAAYWMFTFEETAITTAPPVPTQEVFVPLATPEP
jgi:formate dehydrogenase gamma subunit